MTGKTYSLRIFLFIFILAFLLFMMLATLLNAAHSSVMRRLISGMRFQLVSTSLPRYTYLSTFSMICPSTMSVAYGDCAVRDGIFTEHHLGHRPTWSSIQIPNTRPCECNKPIFMTGYFVATSLLLINMQVMADHVAPSHLYVAFSPAGICCRG